MKIELPEPKKHALRITQEFLESDLKDLNNVWNFIEEQRLVKDSEEQIAFSLELTLAGGCLERAIDHLKKALEKT